MRIFNPICLILLLTACNNTAQVVDQQSSSPNDAAGSNNKTMEEGNRAPILSTIADQATNEDIATGPIAFTINDPDGDPLNCSTSLSIASSNRALIGPTDISLSGTAPNCSLVLNPKSNQNGISTLTLMLNDGSLVDLETFSLTVSNVDDPASLQAVSNFAILQGSSHPTLVDISDNSGGDTDSENQPLTYSCNFDTTPNGSMSGAVACNSANLPGLSFDTSTGIITYNAAYNAPSGVDFQIWGGDNGVADDDEIIFTLTINDVDFAPELPTIGDVYIEINTAMTSINLNDTHTGNDTDRDNEAITYSCGYDQNDDNSVTPINNCDSGVDGFTFNKTTGILAGTPTSLGTYEFKITAATGPNSATSIFTRTVLAGPPPPHLSPHQEWVQVPANAGGLGLPTFWVMKYEAKAWNDTDSDTVVDAGELTDGSHLHKGSHKPASVADAQPWGNLIESEVITECESLGAGYALITNTEWMAIARDVENVPANWTGNAVGSGCLFRGNTMETTVGDGNGVGDSCGYNGIGEESGTGRDIRAALELSNGQKVFDMAGNIWEMVDWDDPTSPTPGFQYAPAGCSHIATELPSVSCGGLLDEEFNTINGNFNTTHGVGIFRGGNGRLTTRGGWSQGREDAGIFQLNWTAWPNSRYGNYGFRCVYRN